MKFLALSALVGLGLLAKQSQSTFAKDQVVSSFAYNNDQPYFNAVPSPIASTTLNFNQGLQNLFNNLNIFGKSQTNGGLSQGASFTTTSKQQKPYSSNLKSEVVKEPIKSALNKLIPRNPLQKIDSSKWGVFDNYKKEICSSPRMWDGKKCKCPNNGCYLSGKCYPEQPKQKKDLLSLRFINRNFDGTQNNLNNPQWGSKGSQLLRLCSPNYQDGKSKMWQHMPRPRQISNLVGQLEGTVRQSHLGLNMLFNIWGQFLDHDITLSPTTQDQKINIQIPRCDKYMDKNCSGKQQLSLTRSIHTGSEVRTNINVLTPWIDASQVYGSDKQTADGLRQFKYGKLKTSAGNLLPKNQQGGFIAGDFRVDQNVALTIFQTIFLRQHNRLCDVILQKNSHLTDQEVFQIARNYVIGLVQHITFDQYLPLLLGKHNYDKLIGPYKYDPTVSPNIYTQFSAAAFRLGHPLINAPFRKMDNWGNVVDKLQLGQMFFNPSLVTNQSVTQFLNGLARTGAKQRSLELVKDLRNFLFFPPNAEVKLDLFSFNIQRGRDHGICSVKDARQVMGLSEKTFKDLFQNQEKAKCLQKIYQSTDNLDLWLGIIGQKSQSGSPLGQLGIKMNAFQFKKIRNGDRFWYENTYPQTIVKQIKGTSFGDIIKRNSGVKFIGHQTFRKC